MAVRFEVKLAAAAEVAALNPVSRIAAIDIMTSEWYKTWARRCRRNIVKTQKG